MANSEELKQGQFLGTTQMYNLEKNATNVEDFNARLRQNLNNMIIALNAKVAGYYSQEEYMNGKLFYPDYVNTYNSTDAPPTFRQVYSKTIDIGTLRNAAGTSTYAHNISGSPTAGTTPFVFVTITGSATDPINRTFIPLPYPSPVAADNIEVYADDTNVYIKVGKNWSAYTKSFIHLEYIKF